MAKLSSRTAAVVGDIVDTAILWLDNAASSSSFKATWLTIRTKLETYFPTRSDVTAEIAAAVVGLLDDKGNYDASTNSPDLDTTPSGIKKGDSYLVSVAGTFFSEDVQVGDWLRALQDDPTTLAHWAIANSNFDPADILDESAVDARVALVASGRKTKDFWMRKDMYPATLQQPSTEITIGTLSNAHLVARLFDPTAVECVLFNWVIPDNFDESWGVAFIPIWTPQSTNTGNAVFELRARAYPEGDAIDQGHLAPLLSSTDQALGGVNNIQYGPESSNNTFSSSLIKGRAVNFRYQRLSSDVGDTFTADAAIIGLRLVWMTDAPTED